MNLPDKCSIFCQHTALKHPVSLAAMRPWEGPPLSCSIGKVFGGRLDDDDA